MLSNLEIAKSFQLLAKLMELHGENPFKIRSYQNAYTSLKKLEEPLHALTTDQLLEVKGLGKSTTTKTIELLQSGKMQKLEEYKSQTPEGVVDLLQVKGLGAKKVRTVWKEMGVESPGELLYACYENRLIELPGFGLKTQHDLREKIEYFLESRDKYLYATVEPNASYILEQLQNTFPNHRCVWVGELARACPVIHTLEFLIAGPVDISELTDQKDFELISVEEGSYRITAHEIYTFRLFHTTAQEFAVQQFKLTGAPAFVEAFPLTEERFETQEQIFESAKIRWIVPEMREDDVLLKQPDHIPEAGEIIAVDDIKGVIHNHSTYSDGLHSLEAMASYVRTSGYAYLVISDHSASAVYANGLSAERLLQQMAEVDALNVNLAPFQIFKGIESDILSDGSLDYPPEILSQLDVVIASIHSNLKMDLEKASARVIKAVENPHTHILGHPTGRLLLSRQGYPLDHKKVIEACAANNVAIELNANPLRLDMDYTYIPYAQEKGVRISINPDAHSKGAIHNLKFGVLAARKGGLLKRNCLNALDTDAFADWLESKR